MAPWSAPNPFHLVQVGARADGLARLSTLSLAKQRMLARVFLAARYLLDRVSGPPSRAEQLLALRRRLVAQDGPGSASRAEQQLALRLRELRERLAAQWGRVEACAHCAPAPSPDWPGGRCCSAETEELFSEHELAALRLAGTTAAALKPPRGSHSGCAFRGSSGCSLAVAQRPCVCVGYACRELLVELRRRGDVPAIVRLQDELQLTFQRFVVERTARLQATRFEELKAGLLARAG